MDNLILQLNLSYRQVKLMKKMYGKNLGREIAIGRRLVKFMKDRYNAH